MAHADPARPECWKATVDESWCYPVNAQRFLGCDPTIASRADCERYGVHGDAAAHGFARLRDGGAVDFRREELPNGSAVGFIGGTGRCYSVLRSLTAEERFVGINLNYANPSDVRRLCCLDVASADAEQLDEKGRRWIPRCTLAIGDHDTHEDLATGVKWSAGAERYLSDAKPREDFNASLRAAAAGVDPAQPGTEATAFVSAAMRKAGESLAAVGEAAKRCAESAMLAPTAMRYITDGEHAARGFCAFVDGLKRWAALCSCGALGPDIADNLHAASCRTVRARREAPLVALVAAVPAGLDPIGWRAAVLAVHECQSRYGSAIQGDHFAAWLMHSLREDIDDCDAGTPYAYGYHGYLRAIAPAPKVDRVRATWKTRGPLLAVDRGDE